MLWQLIIVGVAILAAVVIALRYRLQPRHTNLRWHISTALIAVNAFYGFVRGRGTWVGYVAHPILVLSAVWGLKPSTFEDRLLAFSYVAFAVAGTLLEPMADAAGVVYLLYLAWQVDTFKAVWPAVCAMETGIVAVLFSTADSDEVTLRAEHYTWWSITLFVLWDLILFVEAYLYHDMYTPYKRNASNSFAGTISIVTIVVCIGVLYMSANGCDLLSDALDEVGSTAYIFGNFFMHYYPLVRLFAYQPVFKYANMVRGVGLGLVYSVAYPATDVYGCAKPVPAYMPALMTSVGFAVTAILWTVQFLTTRNFEGIL